MKMGNHSGFDKFVLVDFSSRLGCYALRGRRLADSGTVEQTSGLVHFGGDHGEAPAVFTGAHRFEGSVERQQMGLADNMVRKHFAVSFEKSG